MRSAARRSAPSLAAISRRDVLARAACGAAALPCIARWLESPLASAEYQPLNRYPRMVQEYFVRRVRELEAQRSKVLDAMTTRAEAEQYVKTVREKIR